MSKATEQNINVDRLRLLLIDLVDELEDKGLIDRATSVHDFATDFLDWLEDNNG